MKQTSRTLFVASVIAVATLTACGGGGGGDSPAAGSASTTPGIPGTPNQPGTNPASPSNGFFGSTLVSTQPPIPTYAAGSDELKVFERLNADRLACGFGSLRQNTKLDIASLNHTNYLVNNNQFGHDQELIFSSGPNIGKPTVNFTGKIIYDRYDYVGYSYSGGYATEVLSSGRLGVEGLKRLLSAPYHSKALLSRVRELGISQSPRLNKAILNIELAHNKAEGNQLLASDVVATYPCQGTSDTATKLLGETPTPIPGRNLSLNPTGMPITMLTREGNTLLIASASMTQVNNSAVVTLRTPVTSLNDYTYRYQPNEAYVMPDGPLLPNTLYQVNISGTNNAVPFTKSFTFTTGAT